MTEAQRKGILDRLEQALSIIEEFKDIPIEAWNAAVDNYKAGVNDLIKFQISMTEQLRRVSESMKTIC